MRLWSLDPSYLDAKGLVALWREGLLALHVLRGQTKGYTHHPQLLRFQKHAQPVAAIKYYLSIIQQEATRRGYHFDRSKLGVVKPVTRIAVTDGQLAYEWGWLQQKLRQRDPKHLTSIKNTNGPRLHPSFRKVAGPIADWEKI